MNMVKATQKTWQLLAFFMATMLAFSIFGSATQAVAVTTTTAAWGH